MTSQPIDREGEVTTASPPYPSPVASKSAELLPCPFDDGQGLHGAKVRDNGRDGCGPADTWWMQCKCGAEGPNARDPAEAATLWNRRPSFPPEIERELRGILAMTDEECRAVGIAEFGSEDAWHAAMAELKFKMLTAADAHVAAKAPTPDPAVMRDYIERLTRFFIDRPEWVTLAEEARGYIAALAPQAPVAAGNGGEGRHRPEHAPK